MALPHACRSLARPFVIFCCTLLWTVPGIGETYFIDATPESGDVLTHSVNVPAWGDYDNDGWPDLFLGAVLGHNEGNGRFTEQPVPEALMSKHGVFGDYDNDGDLDLYSITSSTWLEGWYNREGLEGVDALGRNDGSVFTDVILESGLTDTLPTMDSVWLDFDRDGFIDWFQSTRIDPIGSPEHFSNFLLYRNNGDGTFAEVTLAAGLGEVNPVAGGEVVGLAAADLTNDGWPDLYIGTQEGQNWLFHHDGRGKFLDATTAEIAESGPVTGVAVGDINNDGNLDIFQTSIIIEGEFVGNWRSVMFMNLGEGIFLDVTEGVGMAELIQESRFGPCLGDIDNDGDLDLLTTQPPALYLNDGNGQFADHTDQSGMTEYSSRFVAAWGDYDLDGFLDVYIAAGSPVGNRLFRNSGNDNHWLRIELVGVESNRTGIGARLIATAGELRQVQEILGGLGSQQDEMVAHFGLGARTRVDSLEIRWPSGQVDLLTDVPADQQIRVFEGREGYHGVRPTTWVTSLPDSLVAGGTFHGTVSVRPARFAPEAEITRAVANLSEMGGAEAVPLQASGDGTWQVETTLNLPEAHGYKTVSVRIDQSTPVGDYWTQLSRTLLVLPAENRGVFGDGLGSGWQLGPADTGAEAKLGFVSDRDGTLNIDLINGNGTNRVRLTQNEGHMVGWKHDGLLFPSWDWSPDGKQIVVAAHLDGPPAIYVLDADGTHLRKLTHPQENHYDLFPAWSPDGTKIAFTSDRTGDQEIWVMDADGSHPVQLTDHLGKDRTPCWSPDGTKIAFASQRHMGEGNDNTEIYVMDADGGNPVRLTNIPVNNHSPAWSPDGTKIAFRSAGNGIFVMDADGSDPAPLPGAEMGWSPSWSPDGTKIAFWGDLEGIFTVGLDGSGLIRVAWPYFDVYIPVWLPRGASSPVQVLNTEAAAVTYRGRQARKLQAEKLWLATYQAADPVVPTGYQSLGFAFHPGDALLSEEGWLKIRVNDTQLDLLEERIDVTRQEWQEVEIPLEAFALKGPVEQIEFSGLLKGTFYLADIRLVTAAQGRPMTAVTEEQVGLPGQFALEQNYPNPFNSATMIRFALPENEAVELEVFNLMGQKVATLVEGVHQAGTYAIRWDGRDDDGRQLASGVYLYRLRVGDGEQVATRKLLLLQ